VKQYSKLLGVIVFTGIMIYIPWEKVQGIGFVDLKNYKDYFLYGQSILEYSDFSNLFDYITKEALWHYLIMTLVRSFGFPIDLVFVAISAICIGTFSIFLAKRQSVISLVLLVNPLVVALAFSQLRSALAFSLLLIAYMVNKRTIKYILVGVALFLHTSIILFILLFFAVRVVKARLDDRRNNSFMAYMILCLLGLSVAVAIGPLRELVLGYFGDRRASYGDASSSLLYSSFWVGLLLLCALQNREFFKDEVNCYTIVILSLVTFNMFTGGYSTRFLALSFPLILSTLLDFKGVARMVSILAYISYASFQWVYWLQTKIV
jgi:hypothetical protein